MASAESEWPISPSETEHTTMDLLTTAKNIADRVEAESARTDFASAVARHFPAGVSAAAAFCCGFACGDDPPHAMADTKKRARAPRDMAGIIFRRSRGVHRALS